MASARLLKSWKEIYDALGCTGFSLTGRHAEQLRPRTSAPPPEQAHSVPTARPKRLRRKSKPSGR